MKDQDRFGLRGPVKKCESSRTWYSRGCGPDACNTEERSDQMLVEFRPDGSLKQQWQKGPLPHASEWTTFYDYNAANQLSSMRTEQGGTVTSTRVLEYDSEGRISRRIAPSPDGTPQLSEIYSYEPDGRKKKTTSFEPHLTCEAGGCGPTFGVDGTEVAYGAPGTTRITSLYDDHARPMEHVFHDESGELVARLDFRYDDRGNVIGETRKLQKLQPEIMAQVPPEQLATFREVFTIRRTHRYDEQNRKVETTLTMAPNDTNRETFAYNDHGDLISQISETSHAEYDLDTENGLTPKPDTTRSHRSETQLRYQYDSHGNWTEKIVQSLDGQTWSIERRTITYFGNSGSDV